MKSKNICTIIFTICLLSSGLTYGNIVSATEKPLEFESYQFFIIERNDTIEIYKTVDLSKPSIILDIDVSSLTEFDQKQLKKGIRVENKVKLNKIVEDLTG